MGKIKIATHNAQIYKAEENITFINKDYLLLDKAQDFLAPVDVVFVSPPWGGLTYSKDQVYNLELIKPNFREIVRKSLSLADNVVLFLPRNVNIQQLSDILLSFESIYAAPHQECIVTLEAIIYGGRNLSAVVAFIGPLFQVLMAPF